MARPAEAFLNLKADAGRLSAPLTRDQQDPVEQHTSETPAASEKTMGFQN